MNIYIVIAASGKWSDRIEWPVAAFSTEDRVKDYINLLEKTYKSFDQNICGFQREEADRDALDAAMGVLDARFYEDYTGTSWFIEQVEWKE